MRLEQSGLAVGKDYQERSWRQIAQLVRISGQLLAGERGTLLQCRNLGR